MEEKIKILITGMTAAEFDKKPQIRCHYCHRSQGEDSVIFVEGIRIDRKPGSGFLPALRLDCSFILQQRN